jgi:excinuclease ABC subunit B
MKEFTLVSEFEPAGDQPEAINGLVKGIEKGVDRQTLLGVTGSGKTFTVAKVIEEIQKPTLVIAHNKTLAAQLAQEYREFFPDNAVHYFVSYYDYYQPEAYLPVSDTYIEKEAQINEEINRLRHATTQALLTRKDVIIVASVSCIYGLGSPVNYEKVNKRLEVGQPLVRSEFVRSLIEVHYERTTADLKPGLFRVTGNVLEIMPVSSNQIVRIEISGGVIESITLIDAITRGILEKLKYFFIFPAKHFITDGAAQERAIKSIASDLKGRLVELRSEGKNLEAERLEKRTNYDLALIREVGYCNGIENYSRHFSGKKVGEAPDTLLAYFPHKKDGSPDFLTVIDESHVTVPQIGGMYAGDRARKENLVAHGFRLPSAKDNRPLQFNEFEERVGQTLFVSATPGKFEKEHSKTVVEQVIRPTGLIDPVISVKPVTEKGTYKGQVKDFVDTAEEVIAKGDRVIATTLTKKMAEDLSDYLKERGVKAEYLHSDIKTIQRIEILTQFRRGEFDCLVGVNLLREGLDLPEVSFIGILDADKEGFLRSETSLVQIIGRAARNVNGHVRLYADRVTGSMERAMGETERRRVLQLEYNKKHGITPMTIKKQIKDITDQIQTKHQKAVQELLIIDADLSQRELKVRIKEKRTRMEEVVKDLDFETAAILRDEIYKLDEIYDSRKVEDDKKRVKMKVK